MQLVRLKLKQNFKQWQPFDPKRKQVLEQVADMC